MSSKCTAMIQVISILLLQSVVSRPSIFDSKDFQDSTPINKVGYLADVQPCGEGMFRDPLEILGEKFSENRTVHLCKAYLHMFADVISDVIFLPCGIKLCAEVCDGYQESMNIDIRVNVTLISSICDYTGATTVVENSDNSTCPDLSTACVCYFNVRCNRRTKSVTYTFTPNRKGYLRITAANSGVPVYVT